jgi:NADPH:quinone reductase-like Zn-dependent oxidoreductase
VPITLRVKGARTCGTVRAMNDVQAELPPKVRAVGYHEHGGPEVLQALEIPRPVVRPGHVLVEIKAVSINHLDLWVRRGLPHLRHTYPHVGGSDGAGVVVEVGDDVRNVELGQPVLINPGTSCMACEACLTGADNLCRHYGINGENRPGICAEIVLVPAANILPFPAGLTWAQGASLPLTFLTAWQMLVIKARVKPGDVVLVQAGGSGVGSAGIQIARLYGATVITTASSKDKLDRALELGAHHAINYKEQDFLAEVRGITQKRGVDIVFDSVGADVWEKNIKALRWGGRLVTCGATSGFAAQTDLRHVFFRQIEILGSTMGPKGSLFEVLRHVESGALRPVVDSVYSFSDASKAHEHVEARRNFGKVLLAPDGVDAQASVAL